MVEPLRQSASSPAPSDPKPASRRRKHRWLTALNLLYLFFLAFLAFFNLSGPEEWWFSSLNLYLPQWLWVLPSLLLLPLTLWLTKRRFWMPLIGLIYSIGPGMGLCLNIPTHYTDKGIHLRVMTYNVKWDMRNEQEIIQDIARQKPDLLQLQDAIGVLDGPLGRFLSGWHVQSHGQYVVASRYPLSNLDVNDFSFPGGVHDFVRTTLTVDGRKLIIYDVHLLSPREGLVGIRHRQTEEMQENTTRRVYQSELLASRLHNETGPILLTGDLNSPVQAIACRNLMDADLEDAFSEAGFGFGYTYGQYTKLRHPFMRIDHILFRPPWKAERCWVGNTRGSDHVPVIADLFLPASGN